MMLQKWEDQYDAAITVLHFSEGYLFLMQANV